MEDKDYKEILKQTTVDNSRLEEILKKEITPQMQEEFFEILKESQLFLPVTFSENMFEGIENSKEGDIFETTGKEGFDINYLTDADGNRAVPLFTSDDVMDEAGLRSSVMVMFVSDIVNMLKQSDRYSAVAINPLTEYEITMPFDAFLRLFDEPTDEQKEFFESLSKILEILKKDSYELEKDIAFMVRDDDDFMKENAVDGVFTPNVPFYISGNPRFCENLKYTNILLFDKGRKVLPLGEVPKDMPDTLVAPGSEFKFIEDLDEFTRVWKCVAQPFYDD